MANRSLKSSKGSLHQCNPCSLPESSNVNLDNPHYVTFQPNKLESIHRWYPFIEGFSSHFVSSFIDEFCTKHGKIFDPFGGCGTTSLEACVKGFDSVSVDLNPFMCFVARTKSFLRYDLNKLQRTIYRLKKILSNSPSKAPDNIIKSLFSDKNYFSPNILEKIKIIKWHVTRIKDKDIKNLCLLALSSLLVKVSNLKRAPDLRYKKNALLDAPLFDYFLDIVQHMHCDLSQIQLTKIGTAKVFAEDIKSMTLLRNDFRNTFDMLITSPPYLNGTNYFRNTKLELWILDYLNSDNDLKNFRIKSISGGINSTQLRRGSDSPFPGVKVIVDQMMDSAYDKRIPVMVSSYFNDMYEALVQMHAVLKKNRHCIMVVGDSFFRDTLVPTDLLLADVAERIGFKLVDIRLARHRKSRGGFKLRESILILKKVRNEHKTTTTSK